MAVSDLDPLMKWAEDEFDAQGNLTKNIPPDEQQQTGLVKGEPWPRLWMNHTLNNFSAYIEQLVDDPTGTSKITDGTGTAPTNVTEAGDEWGGTWSVDTVSLAGYNIFTKTAA